MMRIAKSNNPKVEMAQAISCAKESDYCWWGTAKNAVFAEEILIFQVGNSSCAYGVLHAVEIKDGNQISDSEFTAHRPPSWGKERIYGRYYKITGGFLKTISREAILRENGLPLRATDLRTNVKVTL